MASLQENTKVELIVEAFENLAIATAQSLITAHYIRPHTEITPELCMVAQSDARAQMAEALREFLKPALRIVTNSREDRVGDISTTIVHSVATRSAE